MTAFVDTQTNNAALQASSRRVAAGEFDALVRMANDTWSPSAAGRGTIKSIIIPARRIRIFKNLSRLYTGPNVWTNGSVTLVVGYAAYTCGNVGGSVNTSTTAVTWVSGDLFSLSWTGYITINGVQYTVSSVTDSQHLTLTATAGTQSAVAYDKSGTSEAANTLFFHDSVSPQGGVIDEAQDGYNGASVDFYTQNGLQITFTVAAADMGTADMFNLNVAYAELVGG